MYPRTFGFALCAQRQFRLQSWRTVELQRIRDYSLLQRRTLHGSRALLFSADRSKLQETLNLLKEQLKQEQREGLARKQLAERSKQVVLEPAHVRWPRAIKEGAKHYYHGFRLLLLEMWLSSKYIWRFLRRKPLMRRERQQLVRTLSDVLRLIPFSAFIIIPFMEFTLPFFLKLFPNMLPSTFKDASKEEEKIRRKLRAKLETAKLIQAAMEEMALYKQKKSDDKYAGIAVEFAEFIKKVRSEGSYVTNKDLLRFIKLFEDELTLDNLPLNTLRALCRLVNVQPFGSIEMIRFQLAMKLRALKTDDHEIAYEGGVNALTLTELQQACRARGMRAYGLPEERLKEQLSQWLELSLNDKVPPSLLLLSRTIYLPEDITFKDRLKALVTSLPENIAEETRQKLTELEGEQVSYEARLQLIQNIEKAISDERKAMAEAKKEEEKEAIEKAEAAEAAAAAPVEPPLEVEAEIVDKAPILEVVPTPPSSEADEAKAEAAAPKVKIDLKSVQSLEEAIHGGPILEAKHDIHELKEQVSEYNEEIKELDLLVKDLKEPRGAKMLRARINKMLKTADALLHKLEEERKALGEASADSASEDETTKKAKLMRVGDLISSMQKIQKMTEEEQNELKKILHALDEDSDGYINVDLVLRALDMFSNHKHLRLSTEQIKTLVEMLKKEEQMEAIDKFIAGAIPYPPSVAEPEINQTTETTATKTKPMPTSKPTSNQKSLPKIPPLSSSTETPKKESSNRI